MKSVFLSMVLLFGVAPLEAREPAQAFDIVITNGRITGRHRMPVQSMSESRRDEIAHGAISVAIRIASYQRAGGRR